MFSRIHILLKDNYITLHMMAYTYFFLYDMKIAMRIFQTLVARTPYLMYDVYTNDSLHGVCFSTVVLVTDLAALSQKVTTHQSRQNLKTNTSYDLCNINMTAIPLQDLAFEQRNRRNYLFSKTKWLILTLIYV